MKYQYNYKKIIWDIVRGKLKWKEIKKAKLIAELYSEIVTKKVPVNLGHIKKLLKIRITDIKNTIDIHNRYVIGKENKFTIPIMKILFTELNSHSYRFGPQFSILTAIIKNCLKDLD